VLKLADKAAPAPLAKAHELALRLVSDEIFVDPGVRKARPGLSIRLIALGLGACGWPSKESENRSPMVLTLSRED
jgi:hypothetical protein